MAFSYVVMQGLPQTLPHFQSSTNAVSMFANILYGRKRYIIYCVLLLFHDIHVHVYECLTSSILFIYIYIRVQYSMSCFSLLQCYQTDSCT